MQDNQFIFCLEAVSDVEKVTVTDIQHQLERLALNYEIASIYKTCDTIEGLEESLSALLYDDHNFTNYEIIYLVMQGEDNTICIYDYYYSLDEIAELFEGKMKGKIIHFANTKTLELTNDEAQFFLDVTGAKAISGYGAKYTNLKSYNLDLEFFKFFQDNENIDEVVETLFEKNYALCKVLDFRLYY
ncbi:DUF6642 family protein [Flavobacterium sp.]|jgi:hypothetical protein|uniref:DUF6642 family protein n=1 Tax=Flavobacterium sp. TaxID=239 RepID=UPI0037BEBBA1